MRLLTNRNEPPFNPGGALSLHGTRKALRKISLALICGLVLVITAVILYCIRNMGLVHVLSVIFSDL